MLSISVEELGSEQDSGGYPIVANGLDGFVGFVSTVHQTENEEWLSTDSMTLCRVFVGEDNRVSVEMDGTKCHQTKKDQGIRYLRYCRVRREK